MTNFPNRKLPRLKEFDYSRSGAYFVTICSHGKNHLFGEIKNGQIHLNGLGEIINREILKIQIHYYNIEIDKYVIMPNHVHMIICILGAEGINPFPTKKNDISNVIGKFKAGVTRIAGNAFMHSEKTRIWQSSYHDHKIRDKEDYNKISEYIDTNPLKWELDCFYNSKKEQ
ncbi:MAG: transposase [Clostridia bacterium]|nr:transposase [Clostridia bacterium]